MKLGTWLLAMCEPLLAKILLSLGFSVVSIVGMEVVVNTVKDQVIAGMSSMPAVWLNFALYLWLGKALGVIFGAIATKLTLWSVQNATSMLGRAP
jgi:hypothetical protein